MRQRTADPQGFQHVSVEDGEQRRVQAKAKSDGCDHGQDKARRAAESWQGVANVLRYGFDEPQSARVSIFLSPSPDRQNFHREGTGARQSLTAFQQALLRKYDPQILLLKNVKYWCLLPPYAGLLLLSAGNIWASPAQGRPVYTEVIAAAIYTGAFAEIWRLNEGSGVRRLERERARLLERMRPGDPCYAQQRSFAQAS